MEMLALGISDFPEKINKGVKQYRRRSMGDDQFFEQSRLITQSSSGLLYIPVLS